MDFFQSAYKMYHSTETALLRVQNDILHDIDKKKVSLLVLLDLSAAFDTIDHTILLKRLRNKFGIKGTALNWIKSYLSCRTQKVKVGDKYSETKEIKYGVPQGSVLGPILFTMYMSPLGDIVRKHGMSYHIYADDTQIYLAFEADSATNNEQLAHSRLEACIKDVKKFLLINRMKLNDDKTEFLITGTDQQRKKLEMHTINVGNTEITVSESVKNLGVYLDSELKMEKHVNDICRRGYYKLRNFAEIRPYLDEDTARTVAQALVTSTLDYGNSLLYGISEKLIHKLQVFQNAVVRVVKRLKKYDHITEARKELHWLPVKERIIHKLLTITWKALHNMAPDYLQDLLVIRNTGRSLRSSKALVLEVPKSQNKNGGDRAFAVAAPVEWNKLPAELRNTDNLNTFKKKLKTFLFRLAYGAD